MSACCAASRLLTETFRGSSVAPVFISLDFLHGMLISGGKKHDQITLLDYSQAEDDEEETFQVAVLPCDRRAPLLATRPQMFQQETAGR